MSDVRLSIVSIPIGITIKEKAVNYLNKYTSRLSTCGICLERGFLERAVSNAMAGREWELQRLPALCTYMVDGA